MSKKPKRIEGWKPVDLEPDAPVLLAMRRALGLPDRVDLALIEVPASHG